MSEQVIPMGRSILVRCVMVEKLASGLFLPGAARGVAAHEAPSARLEVIAVGSKCEENIRPGDVLIVSSGQATELRGEREGDEKRYIVHETQVVGIKRMTPTEIQITPEAPPK